MRIKIPNKDVPSELEMMFVDTYLADDSFCPYDLENEVIAATEDRIFIGPNDSSMWYALMVLEKKS